MKLLSLLSLAATLALSAMAPSAHAGEIGLGGFSGGETVIDFESLSSQDEATAIDGLLSSDGVTFDVARVNKDPFYTVLFGTGNEVIAANFVGPTVYSPPIVIDFDTTMNRFGLDGLTNKNVTTVFSLFQGNETDGFTGGRGQNQIQASFGNTEQFENSGHNTIATWNHVTGNGRGSNEMKVIQVTEHVAADPNRYRLACLARVQGPVRLRKKQ